MDPELRSVGIRSNLVQCVIKSEVGIRSQSGEGEIPCCESLGVAVKAKTEFIGECCRKGVKLTESDYMVPDRYRGEKRRYVAGKISGVVLLINVAKAQLIVLRQIEVKAIGGGVGVVEDARSKVNFT